MNPTSISVSLVSRLQARAGRPDVVIAYPPANVAAAGDCPDGEGEAPGRVPRWMPTPRPRATELSCGSFILSVLHGFDPVRCRGLQ